MSETLSSVETINSEALLVALPGKYLTYRLENETYGLQILKVQEIIGMMHITKVPKAPEYVSGVINLRGKVIPVINMRNKFGMEEVETTERTCIIVVQVFQQDHTVTMGFVVDEVSEVLDIQEEQIEPAPTFDSSVNTDFISGMGKIGQDVVMLLSVDKILTSGEINLVSKETQIN